MQKTASSRNELFMEPVMFSRWQDVCICITTVSTHRKICTALISNVDHHGFSLVLHWPSPPILNYASSHYLDGDARYKERFESLLGNESVDKFLVEVTHVALYIIRFYRQFSPIITQCKWYRMLTTLHFVNSHIIMSSYVTQLVYIADFHVGIVFFAIQRQHEVDKTYVVSVMEDLFLCYGCPTELMERWTIWHCLEVTLSESNVVKWYMCIFSSVDVHLYLPELWPTKSVRL